MTHPLFDLTGRVAIVSGAASGMGRITSLGFAEVGADVVLLDINEAGAQETAHEIEKMGRRALPIYCDISDPDQIRAAFERVDSELGRVDVLSNIAGEGIRNDPLDLTENEIQQVMQNLVVGRYICTQEAAKRMMAQGRGSIFSIVSIAGLSALGRGHIAYSMAMGAVAAMTRELSTEWSSLGVRVNAIVCAQIMNQDLKERIAADPVLGASYLRGLPIGRMGDPTDIKGPAIFLASDASGWMTGALIPLDGGNLAKNVSGSHPGIACRGTCLNSIRPYAECRAGVSSLPIFYQLVTREVGRMPQSEQLLALYRQLLIIRNTEEQLARSHQMGLIHGACHTYVGEEAIAAGVCAHLRPDDAVFSTHRGHGHALAKGVSPHEVIAELFGRATGCSQGRGGSMHLFKPEVGMMGTSGIVGPCILQATGAGYSFKLLKTDQIGVAFFGDGAVNNGAFHEGLNLASIWKLPTLFICENNLYATEVPFAYSAGNPNVGNRGPAYGMESVTVDGNDVLAVYEAAQEAVQRARGGEGPTLIECRTYRTRAHSEGMRDAGYRTQEEVEEWKERDPIKRFSEWLLENEEAGTETLAAIEAEVKTTVADAEEFARNSPWPEPDTVIDHVFSQR